MRLGVLLVVVVVGVVIIVGSSRMVGVAVRVDGWWLWLWGG